MAEPDEEALCLRFGDDFLVVDAFAEETDLDFVVALVRRGAAFLRELVEPAVILSSDGTSVERRVGAALVRTFPAFSVFEGGGLFRFAPAFLVPSVFAGDDDVRAGDELSNP